jgi:hypothetical protein
MVAKVLSIYAQILIIGTAFGIGKPSFKRSLKT